MKNASRWFHYTDSYVILTECLKLSGYCETVPMYVIDWDGINHYKTSLNIFNVKRLLVLRTYEMPVIKIKIIIIIIIIIAQNNPKIIIIIIIFNFFIFNSVKCFYGSLNYII
jgi:hypothetical protein